MWRTWGRKKAEVRWLMLRFRDFEIWRGAEPGEIPEISTSTDRQTSTSAVPYLLPASDPYIPVAGTIIHFKLPLPHA
jgi:hypothetical protein